MWAGVVSDTTERSEIRVSLFGLFSFSLVRSRISNPVFDQFGVVVPLPAQVSGVSPSYYNNKNHSLIRELPLGVLKAALWLLLLALVREAYENGFSDVEIEDCVRGGDNQLCLLE